MAEKMSLGVAVKRCRMVADDFGASDDTDYTLSAMAIRLVLARNADLEAALSKAYRQAQDLSETLTEAVSSTNQK